MEFLNGCNKACSDFTKNQTNKTCSEVVNNKPFVSANVNMQIILYFPSLVITRFDAIPKESVIVYFYQYEDEWI